MVGYGKDEKRPMPASFTKLSPWAPMLVVPAMKAATSCGVLASSGSGKPKRARFIPNPKARSPARAMTLRCGSLNFRGSYAL